MPKVSPLMIAPPLIFAGFVALAGIGMFRDNPNDLPSTMIGQRAPAITTDVLGDYPGVTPEAMATGEITLVNFWASWCPPCRAEHPNLLRMAAEGMPIIGVNFKDQAGTATRYLDDDGNPFEAVAFDPQGRTAIDWGVTAPPETFILDAEGTVLFRFAGPLIGSDYEQRFLPELEKARAAQ
ncbi:DsbE family thiol:disulfide interchange protein [uncultured Roseobacter sp.]|uniref:DsbE family thiol:disulfide interchange protein n=1 Tax=uncultured Roseobacter sp. TaxID=114847 RepID=UPI002637396C|nr:DsbE family thiol:disulfide interchange protein [uncultured Roseobacter sp.]